MKLFYAAASPFARKVRILAEEVGLADKIEVIQANPWADEALRAHNPLCKVPTLIGDDGAAVYDSRVICIYLDRLAGAGRVTGASNASLVLEALADGVCEAGVRRIREVRREGGDQHQDIIERQNRAIVAGLDEAERTFTPGGFDIGEMALAAALGYLDFRMPEDAWRDGRPKLKAWFDVIGARPSVSGTIPV